MLVVMTGPLAIEALKSMNIQSIVHSSNPESVNLLEWTAERLVAGKDVGIALTHGGDIGMLYNLARECGRGFLLQRTIDPMRN